MKGAVQGWRKVQCGTLNEGDVWQALGKVWNPERSYWKLFWVLSHGSGATREAAPKQKSSRQGTMATEATGLRGLSRDC
jgi:hypothetical protein